MQEAVGRFVPDGASVCYIPTRSLLGTGLLDSNPTFKKRSARAWLDRWVYGVADWKVFLSTLGPEARETVRVKTQRLSEPLDYGA